MKHFIAIVLIILPCTASSQSQQVPYTLEDRERLIRLEVSQEERFHALNEKIDAQGVSLTERIQAQGDALNKRIDEVQAFLLWGFGMTFTFMLGLVGFVLWDRRSYLKPVISRYKRTGR